MDFDVETVERVVELVAPVGLAVPVALGAPVALVELDALALVVLVALVAELVAPEPVLELPPSASELFDFR